MARLLLGLVVVVVVATIYAVIDCAMIANDRVRGLSKPVWLVIILIIPVIGLLLWFFIGRGRAGRVVRQRLAPDDDPAFTGGSAPRNDPEQDERIRRLEAELAALDAEFDMDVRAKDAPSDAGGAASPGDRGGTDDPPPGRSKKPGAADPDAVAPDARKDRKKPDDRGDAADG